MNTIPAGPATEATPIPLVDRVTVANQVIERLENARFERQGHLAKWLGHYALYLNKFDLGRKESWQSKGFVPALSRAVSFVADTAKQTLVQNKDEWGVIEGDGPRAGLVAPIIQALVYDCLKRSRFQQNLKPNTKAGLLTPGMLWKVYPAASDAAWPGDVRIDPMDYRMVLRDPTGDDSYLFALKSYDYAAVVRMAEAQGWDMEAVQSVKFEGSADPDQAWKARFAEMMGLPDTDQYRKRVYLAEYYGPIYDAAGDEVHRFAYCVIANARIALMDPIPDPFGDGVGCVVGTDLDGRLGAPYGKAFAEDSAGLAESLTKLFNAQTDGAVYDSIPVFGVFRNGLVNKQDLDGGVRPGMAIKCTTDPRTVITRIDTGNPRAGQALEFYQLVNREFQSATNATEISRGLPSERGTSTNTLGEFELKNSLNQQTLSALAADMEDNGLSPMMERAARLIAPSVDLSNKRVAAIAGRQIAEAMDALSQQPEVLAAVAMEMPHQVDPRTGAPAPPDPQSAQYRQALAKVCIAVLQDACRSSKFSARVRGISTFLQRKERAVAVLNAVNVIQGTPAAAKLDWDKVPGAICEVNGIDPQDLLKDDNAPADDNNSGPGAPSGPIAQFIDTNFRFLAPEVQVAALVMLGFPREIAESQVRAQPVGASAGGVATPSNAGPTPDIGPAFTGAGATSNAPAPPLTSGA